MDEVPTVDSAAAGQQTNDVAPAPGETPDLETRRSRNRWFMLGFGAGAGAVLLACLLVNVALPLMILAGVLAADQAALWVPRGADSGYVGEGWTDESSDYSREDVTDELQVDDSGEGTVAGWPTGESSWSESSRAGDPWRGSFTIVTGKRGKTVREVEIEIDAKTTFTRRGRSVSAEKFLDRGDTDWLRVTYTIVDGEPTAKSVVVVGGKEEPEWLWESF